MEYSPNSIIALSVILPLLALVAVFLRILVRTKIQPSKLGIDDWLAVAAGILAAADGAILVTGVILGTQGRVFETIPDDRYIIQGKLDYSTLIVEKSLYGFTKLSVLFFFRRIFLVQNRFKAFSDILIVLIASWTLAYTLAYVLSCGVHPGIWWTPGDPRTPPHCVSVNVLNLTFAVTDVVFDILVVATPFPWLRSVQMRRREKVGVVLIFLLGTLSTIAAVIRLGFIAQGFTVGFGNGGNNHGSGVAPDVWSTVEGSVGVLAACLPPLGPIIRMAPGPRRLSSSIRSMLDSRKFSKFGSFRAGSRGPENATAAGPDMAQQPISHAYSRDDRNGGPRFNEPNWEQQESQRMNRSVGRDGRRPSARGPKEQTSVEEFV